MGARPFLALFASLVSAAACATTDRPDPMRYRLAHSGTHWDRVGDDPVLDDLLPRYPEFFAVILDPSRSDDPDLGPLRDDLERSPVDRRNYDALNAVAVGYFEVNYRGERVRELGSLRFMAEGFRAAHLAAVPWRAYGEIDEGALRDAILDFFEDAATGEKLGTRATAGRLAGLVASLERKEPDLERARRIRALTARLRAAEQVRPVVPPARAD